MKIAAGATSFVPSAQVLAPGAFHGMRLRHTVRPTGSLDWLLIYTLGGSGLYRFEGGEYRSVAQTLTLYRPGVYQNYQIAPNGHGWDIMYAHFQPKADWLPLLRWPELVPGLMTLSLKDPALRRRMISRWRDVIGFCGGTQPRGVALGQNALEETLLWCDAVNPRQVLEQLDLRVRKAIEYLTVQVAEPFDEEGLARAAGLSPSRLRHLFRLQMGDSPRSFLEQLRLKKARELLALSRQTIGEIAQELGFENPFYFSLRFKKQTGESPRAYRQRITRR